jgi:uncharacterized membrane protein
MGAHSPKHDYLLLVAVVLLVWSFVSQTCDIRFITSLTQEAGFGAELGVHPQQGSVGSFCFQFILSICMPPYCW